MPDDHNKSPRHVPRLYLVTPPVAAPADLPSDFGSVLAAAQVAAVLLRLAPADERRLTNLIKVVAEPVQQAGAALLVEGHVELIGRAGADGAHLDGGAALKAALPHLKPDRIAGAGALASRHDAMTAAELGADYVMFGEPSPDGLRPAFAAVLERLEWWSEVFQIPCVGYAETLEEVAAVAAAGADFVALAPGVFADVRGLGAALADAMAQLHGEVAS
ncbi:thiamine phosphate synthase [Xanthobacteraceae bacterium Astr-EGSB]|uniref:thiamine phosphate synthase n=1 Tax=Astrobacterium formosum TaxID=3069710 RepID=UPI0027B258F2|nr:thiamine phosphate synthase [Xanthobacteraceae bacterium Astr-EGSB]